MSPRKQPTSTELQYNHIHNWTPYKPKKINIYKQWFLDDPRKQLGDQNITTYSISITKTQERAKFMPSKL
jgi:hypothetical protein